MGSTWDLLQGDPRSGCRVPPQPCLEALVQLPKPTSPSHRGHGDPCRILCSGTLLPAAVSPAGSAGIRGLARGATVAPGRGQPGGHAAGAGRGAGAVPGAALGRAVHPRAPAQVGTPARPPPSHQHWPRRGSRDFFCRRTLAAVGHAGIPGSERLSRCGSSGDSQLGASPGYLFAKCFWVLLTSCFFFF